MTLQLEAVQIAHGILVRRVFSRQAAGYDQEELKQDLAVHVLANLKYYKPERGPLRTFVGMTFDNWWRQSIKDRLTRKEHEESRWEMPETAEPSALRADRELSARGRRILQQLPAHSREVAELHIAYGVPLKAVAELTGTKYQTVNSRARRARQLLAQMV